MKSKAGLPKNFTSVYYYYLTQKSTKYERNWCLLDYDACVFSSFFSIFDLNGR